MKTQIRKLWVTALRSGDFIQGRSRLRRKRGNKITHCCLGVLGELYCGTHNIPWDGKLVGIDQGLSKKVMDWAGLRHTMGDKVSIKEGTGMYHLAIHNDEGRTFSEIAEAIEDQL